MRNNTWSGKMSAPAPQKPEEKAVAENQKKMPEPERRPVPDAPAKPEKNRLAEHTPVQEAVKKPVLPMPEQPTAKKEEIRPIGHEPGKSGPAGYEAVLKEGPKALSRTDELPPSLGNEGDADKMPQAVFDDPAAISIHVDSYRRIRRSRMMGNMNMRSPVNAICLLITVAAAVAVALNWELVTTTLAYWVLVALANLAAVLLLIAAVAVLVLLIRGRRGRGGLLRRLFR